MTADEIIEYVLHTPDNSNSNILRDMIKAIQNSANMEDILITDPKKDQILSYDNELKKWINVYIFDKIILE